MSVRTTPLKAIRRQCVECSGGNRTEVRNCEMEHCPLYLFRMGHNPKPEEQVKRKRVMVQDKEGKDGNA